MTREHNRCIGKTRHNGCMGVHTPEDFKPDSRG